MRTPRIRISIKGEQIIAHAVSVCPPPAYNSGFADIPDLSEPENFGAGMDRARREALSDLIDGLTKFRADIDAAIEAARGMM